jgi:hypothetical protein
VCPKLNGYNLTGKIDIFINKNNYPIQLILIAQNTNSMSYSPPSRPKKGKVKVDFSGFWMRG